MNIPYAEDLFDAALDVINNVDEVSTCGPMTTLTVSTDLYEKLVEAVCTNMRESRARRYG